MTDREKLEEIRKMCEAAFSASFSSQDIDLGRAQALANVYGVILYDGATIANTSDAVRQYEEEHDDQQITFDDLLREENTFEKIAREIMSMPPVSGYNEREPFTVADLARLKHKCDQIRASGLLEDPAFSCTIEMSHADMYDALSVLHQEVQITTMGERFLFGFPVYLSPVDGIRVHVVANLRGDN